MPSYDPDTRALIERNIGDPDKRRRYVDALLRHQVYSLRIGGATTAQALKRIEKVDRQTAIEIARLVGTKGNVEALAARLTAKTAEELFKILAALRHEWIDWAEYSLERNAQELAGFGLVVAPQSRRVARRIAEAALKHRMQVSGGLSVQETLERAVENYSRAIAGVSIRAHAEGATVEQLKGELRGFAFKRDAYIETSARTVLLSVANRAREAHYYKERALIPRVMWLSTLDHRTSSICRTLDGRTYEQGLGPRPPAHPQCRSVVVPLLAGETADDALGLRPSTAGGPDFKYKPGESQAALQRRLRLNRGVQKARRGDDRFKRGTIRVDTYGDFFRRQSAAFQDFVVGPKRGRMYRAGKIRFEQFTDSRGRLIPLAELKERIRGLEL